MGIENMKRFTLGNHIDKIYNKTYRTLVFSKRNLLQYNYSDEPYVKYDFNPKTNLMSRTTIRQAERLILVCKCIHQLAELSTEN